MLQRLYSGFPGGPPGIALAFLRAVIGIAVAMQGGLYLAEPNTTPGIWLSGLLAVAAGALVLIGFLTPIAATAVLLNAASIAFSMSPSPTQNLFDSRISLIFGLTILLSIIGIGPGAFSVDARLFGRREIVIPPNEWAAFR